MRQQGTGKCTGSLFWASDLQRLKMFRKVRVAWVVTIDERDDVRRCNDWLNLVEFSTEAVGSPTERRAMAARTLALEKQAHKLSATERERLAERLLVRMKHARLTAVDEAWVAEAEKRVGAWKRKATKTVSAGKALREIRKELRY
jgi:Putative addiction module component